MTRENLVSNNDSGNRKQVDIIVPLYNEEDGISVFYRQLSTALEPLPYSFNILFVDDGSSDATVDNLRNLQQTDGRIVIIELSRNFGHQAALSAGLELTSGDYIIMMDGDGQHPPALIPEMLRLAEAGNEIVTTQRMDTGKGGFFKRISSDLFYRLANKIGNTRILPGGADFRLMSAEAASSLRSMKEYHRFLRGMVAWMGFKTTILPFEPPERLAGKTKYSLRKMMTLATDAIFSFSLVPLYIGISVGGVFLLLALAEAIYVLSFWISGNSQSLAPGWSSLMFVLLVVGGSIMIMLGFVGIYVGYIFQEVKGRPVFIIRNIFKSEK